MVGLATFAAIIAQPVGPGAASTSSPQNTWAPTTGTGSIASLPQAESFIGATTGPDGQASAIGGAAASTAVPNTYAHNPSTPLAWSQSKPVLTLSGAPGSLSPLVADGGKQYLVGTFKGSLDLLTNAGGTWRQYPTDISDYPLDSGLGLYGLAVSSGVAYVPYIDRHQDVRLAFDPGGPGRPWREVTVLAHANALCGLGIEPGDPAAAVASGQVALAFDDSVCPHQGLNTNLDIYVASVPVAALRSWGPTPTWHIAGVTVPYAVGGDYPALAVDGRDLDLAYEFDNHSGDIGFVQGMPAARGFAWPTKPTRFAAVPKQGMDLPALFLTAGGRAGVQAAAAMFADGVDVWAATLARGRWTSAMLARDVAEGSQRPAAALGDCGPSLSYQLTGPGRSGAAVTTRRGSRWVTQRISPAEASGDDMWPQIVLTAPNVMQLLFLDDDSGKTVLYGARGACRAISAVPPAAPAISGVIDNAANDAATPAPGDSLVVNGSGFGAVQYAGAVELLPAPGAKGVALQVPVQFWSPTSIGATLPPTLAVGTPYRLAVIVRRARGAPAATSNSVPLTISARVVPPTPYLHISFTDGARTAGQPVQPGDLVTIAITSSGSAPRTGKLVLTPAATPAACARSAYGVHCGGPLAPVEGASPITLKQLYWPPLSARLNWPSTVTPGSYTLALQAAGVVSNVVGVTVGSPAPVITSQAVLAFPGQEVTVTGHNFGSGPGSLRLCAIGSTAGAGAALSLQTTDWSGASISFRVPASGAPPGLYSLSVTTDEGVTGDPQELAIEALACGTSPGAAPPLAGPAVPSQTFLLGFSGSVYTLITVDAATEQRTGYTVVGGRVPLGVDGAPEQAASFASNPAGTRVYVAITAPDLHNPSGAVDVQDGTLYVVDTDPSSPRDGQVIASTTVGGDPDAVAVSPDGARVYVANTDSTAIRPSDPNWLQDDPNFPIDKSGSVTELDADGTVIGTISLATAVATALGNKPPDGLAIPVTLTVSPDGGTLYIVGWGPLAVENPTTGSGFSSWVAAVPTATPPASAVPAVTPLPGHSPDALVVSPDGRRLYEADVFSKTDKDAMGGYLNVIDTSDMQVISHLRVGYQVADIALSPDGSRLYVVDPYYQTFLIYDTNSPAFSDGGGGYSTAQTALVAGLSLATIVEPNPVEAFFGGTVKGYIDPIAIALDASGRYAYVADYTAPEASVVDLSDDWVSTVTLPDATGAVAAPTGQPPLVFVAADRSVSVINPASNQLVATVPVGAQAEHSASGIAVTPDGARVLVSAEEASADGSSHASVLSVLDASTFDQLRYATFAVGGLPGWVAANPTAARVAYVSDPGSGTLYAVDTSAAAEHSGHELLPLHGSLALSQADGVTVDPSGQCAYVTDYGANSLSVLRTSTGTVLPPLPAGSGPSSVAVSPAGNAVYVTDTASDEVTTLDPQTGEVIDVTKLPPGAEPDGIVASAACQCLYVSEHGANNVAVLAAATMRTVANIAVGNEPRGLVLDPAGSRVYVADMGSNAVSVIDTASKTVVATVPVGNFPTGIAMDPPAALDTPGPWPAPATGPTA